MFEIESQTQLRDKGILPWYFNKGALWSPTSPRLDAAQCAHTIGHIYNLFTLQTSISNKSVPMGGLDEWHHIPPSEEFTSGWAKSL